jgi:hypothetical protein
LLGSPYIITTNSGVFPGVTLNIEPGVTVQFNNGLVFTVKGTLIAHGSISDSITFTSSAIVPTVSIWTGINIQNDQGGNIDFNYCRGFYAYNFINFLANSTGLAARIRNSRFANNNIVIFNYDPSNYQITIDSSRVENNLFGSIYSNYLTVSNSIFLNNERCIHNWSGPTVQINNSSFMGSSMYALNMSGTVTNTKILNNFTGLRLRSDLVLINDSIANNNVGMEVTAASSIPISNLHDNYICNNTTFNVKHTTTINVYLQNICWCTYDSAYVSSKIWDAYDDLTLGIITYLPFYSSCATPLSISESPVNSGILLSNYPNPFSNKTTFEYSLQKEDYVSIIIQDIQGKIIDTYVNENQLQGKHTLVLENLKLPSGIYYYQLKTSSVLLTKKMIVL